jgi:hypothetical protein
MGFPVAWLDSAPSRQQAIPPAYSRAKSSGGYSLAQRERSLMDGGRMSAHRSVPSSVVPELNVLGLILKELS